MSPLSTRDPLAILHDMERRSRAHAIGMPQREEVKVGWSGIAFRVGKENLLVHADEILEILTYPAITRVPGTQAWVKGVANVRGNLLPVMDLGGYLNGHRTPVNRTTRVLVSNQQGVFVGLVVDEVLGQRQFDEDERFTWDAANDDALDSTPYSAEGFRRDEETWRVFKLGQLTTQSRFMQVAV
ncbi:MAG: purine-binding chemotaxis protein CheW [Gammaproteobacteria bacterium]|nr:purine-binding chemotaxis protein CheW [Gammaproteobacteria bacterium]MCP5136218.1 purine-binding chemotaxis protein CheW [Gammaproteobacteria bacterium]